MFGSRFLGRTLVWAFSLVFNLILVASPSQAAIGDLGPEIIGIATSDNFTCMNAKSGEVYCWGQSTNSNLGTGMESDNAVPHKVYEIKDSVKVDVGNMFACSLGKSGIVSCWGKNDVGQVGDGYEDSTDRMFPSYVAVIRNAVDIAVGDKHACALNDEGSVFCWGDNKFGQLGNISLPTSNLVQTISNSILPIEISIPEPVKNITSGRNHVCALTRTGFVYCWGSNLIGQLGLGFQNISVSKPKIVPTLANILSLKSHYDSTCAKTESSGLYCWGRGSNGELGEVEKVDRFLPRLMSGTYIITNPTTNVATTYTYATSLSNFAFGTNGGCGIDNKSGLGYIVCWGTNTGYEPTSVQALDIVLGKNHGCMITITYTVACWGSNLYGQTGANIQSATWQKYLVLKGIPEWRNYITSWGIAYTNNVATISWTGATENRFALYVEPFGIICEVLSVFNCQVGTLESNTTYQAQLIARGSTVSNSRFANFSFTTGTLISAVDEYKAKLAAQEKAAAEAKAKAALEKLAQSEAAYSAACTDKRNELTEKISADVNYWLTQHLHTYSILSKTSTKLASVIPKNRSLSVKNYVNLANNEITKLKMLSNESRTFVCGGNPYKNTTNLLALETSLAKMLREYNANLFGFFNKWKLALLPTKL